MKGLLIKECLEDDSILDMIEIESVEMWKAESNSPTQPNYWTAISFRTEDPEFLEKLSKSIVNYEWYVDLSDEKDKIIILKNHIIRYPHGDNQEKQNAMDFCRKMGIPANQIDWN